jgi:hypothetical protein
MTESIKANLRVLVEQLQTVEISMELKKLIY